MAATQPENELALTAEEIATGIEKIQKGMDALKNSRLNMSTIEILIAHKTRMSRSYVQRFLGALGSLAKDYLKPKVKK